MGLHRVKPRKPRTYKVASEFDASPHENLAVAIVSQAVNDARALQDSNKVYGNAGGRPVSRWELLNFFRSKWCATLLGTTEISGEDIAKKVGLYDSAE